MNAALSAAQNNQAPDPFLQGPALSDNDSECVASVCEARASCCTDEWDETCAGLAGQRCLSRYLTRPRFEDGRVMVDACVEPRLEGVHACPLAGSGPLGVECCQRTLVLQGVYPVTSAAAPGSQEPYARYSEWYPRRDKLLPSGIGWRDEATLVADPVLHNKDGSVVATTPHHIWQAAGPAGPLYPDCSGSNGVRPCNGIGAGVKDQMVDWTHTAKNGGPLPVRAALVTVLASLITTSGDFEIDLRWYYAPQNGFLPVDHSFDGAPVEAWWASLPKKDAKGVWGYVGKPICHTGQVPTRLPGLATSIPKCSAIYPIGAPYDGTIVSMYQP